MRFIEVAILSLLCISTPVRGATPIAGHYPPGQSGIRGGSSPSSAGWSYTDFSRFFSNLELRGPDGSPLTDVGELRYANISMFTVNTNWHVLGMRFGAMAGIPFSTGNLNPSGDDVGSASFGLGDVLLTPIALYALNPSFDYTLQFTAWSSSGRFTPGSADNRGSGFWSLVYSLGGAWYPGGRDAWSVSAISRFEQNFEQSGSGITPGDDVVVDWGIGRVVRPGEGRIEVGVSGFATWQLTSQDGSPPGTDISRYRYFGIGPEGSISPWEHWTFRLRAQWEFEARNAVQGNNLWLILNYSH